ncbi:MAG: hypothetical protein ABI887_21420 [Burkholderiales bacterium]
MSFIKPTVGRQVWYRPAPDEILVTCGDQPLAATVAAVHSDRCINLQVIDANGKAHARASVLLIHGDEDYGNESYQPVGSYAEWMPFQKGQAKAQEAAAPST